MAIKRIVCTEIVATSHGHRHISAVGVNADLTATSAKDRLSVTQARAQLASPTGDRYITVDSASGKRAHVEPFTCFGIDTLRSNADAIPGNNLDNLRTCSWRS